ncbi:MAG: hypothetical protein KGN16_10385 [Burkholderiales bacterium]|nr:hypothetical protein [Burkholderiales bacterium]
MKGAHNLVTTRMAGFAPPIVTLHLAEGDWPMVNLDGYIQASVDENFERADLRCLFGLKVVVHGPANRQDAVMRACKAVARAQPACVLGFATDKPRLDPAALIVAAGDFAWIEEQLERDPWQN